VSLPVLAADPSIIEQAADPAAFVVLACERAKEWLAQALEHGGIEDIVEIKSQAEAVRVYTAQKQIGKDAELAAAEIVRRAERGIGVAIRRGQEAGEFARVGDSGAPRGPYTRIRLGREQHISPSAVRHTKRRSPREFLTNGSDMVMTYAVTDAVTDEQFDGALSTAKLEKNLSRANVVRHVQQMTSRQPERAAEPDPKDHSARRALIAEMAAENYTSRQIGERLGTADRNVRMIASKHGIEIPADKVVGRSHKHNPNEIVENTAHALEGLAYGVGLVDMGALDMSEAGQWFASLTNSLRVLNRFVRQLKEASNG
jgi:hypothetical protein